MAITVHPRLLEQLLEEESLLLLQVRSEEDPDLLARALTAAAGDIGALDEGEQAPVPIPTPEGPMLLLDLADTPVEDLPAIPELVVLRLTEAGARTAEVRVPPERIHELEAVEGWAPAARCWLRGRGPTAALLDAGRAWLGERAPADAPWFQWSSGAMFPVTARQAGPAADSLLRAGYEATLLVSDFRAGGRALSVLAPSFGGPAQAALGAAGAGIEAPAEMYRARELVRARAGELCWAGVGVEPDARDLLGVTWNDRTGARRQDPRLVSDQLVPDGLWYQLLTAGHLARLGGAPPGAVELAPGVVELTVGEAAQWLPGHPQRDRVRARSRELLAACLATPDELHALSARRLAELRSRPDAG